MEKKVKKKLLNQEREDQKLILHLMYLIQKMKKLIHLQQIHLVGQQVNILNKVDIE